MIKCLLSSLLFLPAGVLYSQQVNLAEMKAPSDYDHVFKAPLFSDPNATSVLLWIEDVVKLHKHETHSEHVIVLKGKGQMRLGDESLQIRKGDVIFIPKGTPHSVKVTSGPLKVISIQAPEFDGSDRVMLEE